jgi:hypothetical protein
MGREVTRAVIEKTIWWTVHRHVHAIERKHAHSLSRQLNRIGTDMHERCSGL